MKTSPAAESHSLLRWVFGHGTHALTCAVNANGAGAFDVCIMPHWNLSSSIVERCASAASAFERHAKISEGLRRKGWVVVQYAATHRL